MIDAKNAADVAHNYLISVYPQLTFKQVQLEEIEKSGEQWLITLSYPSLDITALPFGAPKEYKIFTIGAEDGEVLSMKIRQIK